MDIVLNVQLKDLDLDEALEKYRDGDGEWIDSGTVGHAVVQKVTALALSGEYGKSLKERVQSIRDEQIREQLAPVIAEALARPIQKTNEYGEKRGAAITLRELVIECAHDYLKQSADRHRRERGTVLQVAVNDAVAAAFQAEIAQAVKDVKDSVAGRFGDMVAEVVAKAR